MLKTAQRAALPKLSELGTDLLQLTVPHHNWPRLARRLDPWFDAAGVQPVRLGLRRR